MLGHQLHLARRTKKLSLRATAHRASIDPASVAAVERDAASCAAFAAVVDALELSFANSKGGTAGELLRMTRTARGWSQAALAAAADLSKPTIINLERGGGRMASLSAAFAALGIRPTLVSRAGSTSITRSWRPTGFSCLSGDAEKLLQQAPPENFDACVTDPPYGLIEYPPEVAAAILQAWACGDDYDFRPHPSYLEAEWDTLPQPRLWKQVERSLKPGGWVAAFAAPRTVDLMATAMRLGGFEVRDQVVWLSSRGFARGQDVGRMIDKRRLRALDHEGLLVKPEGVAPIRTRYPRAGSRIEAKQSSLTAANLDQLLSVNGIQPSKWRGFRAALRPAHHVIILARKPFTGYLLDNVEARGTGVLNIEAVRDGGLYPANVVADLPLGLERHFFAPRATAHEKDAYLPAGMMNDHPSPKPVDLMRWLIKLVTVQGALILDPFLGSGTTGIAAALEGRRFVGIERDAGYVEIARHRIEGWRASRGAPDAEAAE